MKQYAHMIKKIRKEQGLTQKELAQMIHVSQQAIARYESQKAEPSLDVLQALSKALSVPAGVFVDENSVSTEQEYLALYRSLSSENKEKVISFLKLLKRQEKEYDEMLNNVLRDNKSIDQ